MDGERRKRKMEEDEIEEEKIEKFFALIKSTREVRERLVGAPEAREAPAAGKPQSSAPAPWNPTFVLEDFVEAPPPPAEAAEKAGTSTEGEKQESGEGSGNKGLDLDLNLSL